MNHDDKIILPDSPEAATYQPMAGGWVTSDFRLWGKGLGAEKAARYHGCTHVRCQRCGEITPKEYALCDACCNKADAERYAAMPRAKWDGETPLYSERNDRFYNTPEEASDDAMEAGVSVDDLRLVICEPVYATPLCSDYCCDDLPYDADLPDEIADAIDAFNEAVAGVILSWRPRKTALDLEEDG